MQPVGLEIIFEDSIIYKMDKYLLGLLAAIFGGIIGVVGKYFTASFSSGTDDVISLRQSLLKRVNQLEEQHVTLRQEHDEIRKEQQKWVVRYWSLYRWTINHCLITDDQKLPPNFHEMEKNEIKKSVKNMYPKPDFPDK